jgi:hypothetical protein
MEGVRKNSGSLVGARKELNLIEGTGTTLTIADSVAYNNAIDVTITNSLTKITVGGVFVGAPPSNANRMVWRAPFACTVTAVKGHAKGGTNAVINAQKNQASTFLSSNLTVSSMNTWTDGGAVQNASLVAGDSIEVMLASTSGAITEVSVQVELTRSA